MNFQKIPNLIKFLFAIIILAGAGILSYFIFYVNTPAETVKIETLLKIDDRNCIAAKNQDLLKMEYTGTLVNGTQFDSSIGKTPFEFTLGSGEVIKGWDHGIVGMCLGEKRKLTISADLGYGPKGVGKIPPNSPLIFVIDLLAINGNTGKAANLADNGLKINILEKIDVSKCIAAKNDDVLKMDYTGKLVDGTQFDSSVGRTPFIFKLGARKVIQGWDLGVLGMCIGEKRKLTIPPELGYGSTGISDIIPPNSTLLFDISLLAINATNGESF